MAMQLLVSNRKQLVLFIFLGVVLVPSLGIVPVVVAPARTPNGAAQSATVMVAFPAVFLLAGIALTAYALRRCPDRFAFSDTLTIHYLFHKRVVPRVDVVDASSEDRAVTLGGHGGSVPLTANDTAVSVRLTDGSQLSWRLPKETAAEFNYALQRWRDGDGSARH